MGEQIQRREAEIASLKEELAAAKAEAADARMELSLATQARGQ